MKAVESRCTVGFVARSQITRYKVDFASSSRPQGPFVLRKIDEKRQAVTGRGAEGLLCDPAAGLSYTRKGAAENNT